MMKILADCALGLLSLLFDLCGNFDLTGLYEAYDLMFELLEVICYFLPMGTVSAIFSVTIALLTMKIMINVLRTLWEILPVL